MTTTIQLTEGEAKLFTALYDDAPNWNGTPLVEVAKSDRGRLTSLKRKGLLTTSTDEQGCVFAHFTELGLAVAVELAMLGIGAPEMVELAKVGKPAEPAPPSTELDVKFLARLNQPIWKVWYEIGPEAATLMEEDGEEMTAEGAMELVLDANRVNEIDREAGKLLEAAYKKHGYKKVLRFLAKAIQL